MDIFFHWVQSHIRILESTPENINALLMGLEYLINISYVDDNEVFKVEFLPSIMEFLLFNKFFQIILDRYWSNMI